MDLWVSSSVLADRTAPLHLSEASFLKTKQESASPSPPPPNGGGPRRGFLRMDADRRLSVFICGLFLGGGAHHHATAPVGIPADPGSIPFGNIPVPANAPLHRVDATEPSEPTVPTGPGQHVSWPKGQQSPQAHWPRAQQCPTGIAERSGCP